MDKIKRFFKYDFFIMLLDIVAVNASYFLALLLRFSINNRLDPLIEKYLYTVIHFAPIYTIICIILFIVFRLYGGMWRYAGIRDVNRIIFANVITAVIHVLATVLFLQRMPITYYVMGAAMQMAAVGFIRFAYRLAVLEKRQIGKSKAVNALVIGTKENGSQTIKLLNIGIQYRPVAVIDSKNQDAGMLMDGIPVYNSDDFATVVSKNKVKAVFLADSSVDKEHRKSIISFCKENQLEFRDYSAFFSYKGDIDSFNEVFNTQRDQVLDERKSIPFSPPDIGESEITEVVEAMRSGWITTGPRVKLLERRLAAYIELGKNTYDTEVNPKDGATVSYVLIQQHLQRN